MYIVSLSTIEFYYKENTILELAAMYSAYKSKRTITEGGDLLDIANYSVDEKDFGYNSIKDSLAGIFLLFEKVMDPRYKVYFHSLTSGHSTNEHYSGFKIIDNLKYSESLLVLMDNFISEGAMYKLLYDWYSLTPLEKMTSFYNDQYVGVLRKINKLIFNLLKPVETNITLQSDMKSDTVTQTIPAKVLTAVPHAVNSADYVVDVYDNNGKDIGEGIIQTRSPGSFEVYSAIALPNTKFYIIGHD